MEAASGSPMEAGKELERELGKAPQSGQDSAQGRAAASG